MSKGPFFTSLGHSVKRTILTSLFPHDGQNGRIGMNESVIHEIVSNETLIDS